MNEFNVNEGRGQMTDLERTMERVQKLLAIAQDERANPAEAAAAASMADKIMRKFQIDHADVVARSMSKADAMTEQDVSALMKRGKGENPNWYRPSKVPSWANWLAVAIGQLHDCNTTYVHTQELGACLRFSGYKPDVQVAAWTFDYLCNAMISSTRRWQKAAKDEGFARGKDESESFRRGFVLQLCTALKNLHKEKEAELQVASASRALVLVKAKAVQERFGIVKYGTHKGKTMSDGNAFSQGREEGKKVNVNARAVGANANNDSLRLR